MAKISDYTVLNTFDSDEEVMSYGVKMVGAEYEWEETMGEGIKVGVIDTGVDVNHPDLKNRIKNCANFTSEDIYDVKDDAGHGTHVCGIIAAERNGTGVVGVAPKCDLYVAKAFNTDGVGDMKNILKSLDWMLKQGVDIVNMSFSSDGFSKQEEMYINKCYVNNIILVAAAGNKGQRERISYPARYKGVISVSAVDINKNKGGFSSYGDEIDLAAAGVDILSTYKDGKYAILSGTSMASPIIAGSAAIIQAKAVSRFKKKLTPYELEKVMAIYADTSDKIRESKCCGYGIFSFGRIR